MLLGKPVAIKKFVNMLLFTLSVFVGFYLPLPAAVLLGLLFIENMKKKIFYEYYNNILRN